MDFRRITIPPKGRNKYGSYQSVGNITKQIISYSNNGNGTTTDNNITNTGTTGGGNTETHKNYSLRLNKTSFTFEWDDINANDGQVDTIIVLGFGDMEDVPTFVGNFDILPTNDSSLSNLNSAEAEEYIYNILKDDNWGIEGIVDGMSVEVENNGTTNTTIKIKVNNNIKQTGGELNIPCHIYTGPDNSKPAPGDMSDWYDCEKKSLFLQYNYTVIMNAVNHYTLDLTNDTAGVNVDVSGEKWATGAILPTCKATLYYGENIVENAKYGLGKTITGVSINTDTGDLTFGSNFWFLADQIEIPIIATIDSFTSKKIMTINKVYPGKDGSNAITRWIVPSVNSITWNPNDNNLSQATISAVVMKQEGGNEPVQDSNTTIYYGWDTTNPTYTYSGPISIEITKTYLSLALKENGKIYEIETIPVIKEGKNGDSTYTLILSNTSASINCDSDGNILTGAIKPACEAYLYYGTQLVDGISYTIETTPIATGLSVSGNKLVYTSNFSFTGNTLQIKWIGKKNNITYGTAIMNITKSLAGKNGDDGSPGAPGVGISGTKVEYAISSSQTTTPTSWSTTIPTLQTEKYLWTKTTWTYTNGTTEVGYQKTYIPKNGADGSDGSPGAPGVGISDTKVEYALTSSTSNTAPTSGWSTTVPSLAQGKYLWTRTTWTYTNGTTEVGYQKTYIGEDGADGSDGSDGADGVSYHLEASQNCFKVNSGGTAQWSSITLTPWKQVGGNTPTSSFTYTIKYGKNTTNATTIISNRTLNYSSDANYYSITLTVNDAIVDRITIPVLRDGTKGKDGSPGDKGERGPTIRGPIDYLQYGDDYGKHIPTGSNGRRWCSGTLTNVAIPDDGHYIDVIYYNGSYYRCKTSYYAKNTHWNSGQIANIISTYWEKADGEFEFVAANLLLANNAKIAGFIFSDNRLISQETNADGTPTLSLDGINGVIEANKGNFKGTLWTPFRDINSEITTDRSNVYLDVNDSTYIKLTSASRGVTSIKTPAIVYLPKITEDILGVQYSFACSAVVSRGQTLYPSRISVSSGDYIIDCDTVNQSTDGKLDQNTGSVAALTALYYNANMNASFIQLTATSLRIYGSLYYVWLVTQKAGARFMNVDRATQTGTSSVGWSTLIVK